MPEEIHHAPTGVAREVSTALPDSQEQTSVPVQPADVAVAANPQPRPRTSIRRTGKVARLPMEARHQVSGMLYAGKTYQQIIHSLEEEGYTGITRQNITNWAKGGYKEWQQQRAHLESVMAKRENLIELAASHGRGRRFDLSDVNNVLLASRYNEILQNLDTSKVAAQIAANPDLLFRFAAEESLRQKRETESVDDREYRAEQKKSRAAIDFQLKLARLTKEQIAELRDSANTPRFATILRELTGSDVPESVLDANSGVNPANL